MTRGHSTLSRVFSSVLAAVNRVFRPELSAATPQADRPAGLRGHPAPAAAVGRGQHQDAGREPGRRRRAGQSRPTRRAPSGIAGQPAVLAAAYRGQPAARWCRSASCADALRRGRMGSEECGSECNRLLISWLSFVSCNGCGGGRFPVAAQLEVQPAELLAGERSRLVFRRGV